MATNISSLSVQVALDASQAENGLAKLGNRVESFAKSIQTAGNFVKGFAVVALAKQAIDAGTAFAKFVDETDKVSKSFGAMFGNLSQGGDVLNGLSDISLRTGADFGNLAQQMEALSGAGFGVAKSLEVVGAAGELDWLFGGNGKGVEAVAGGIAKLNTQVAGSPELFDALRSKGINAYQSLGKAIGTSADEAERLLKAGRLTGFQAARAAANSLQSADAMARRGDADTIAGRIGQWSEPGKKFGQMGDQIWNKELMGLRQFTSAFFAPFADGATTVQAGNVALGGVANQRAEYIRQLTEYFKKAEEALQKSLKSPLDNLLDQFGLLDNQIRLSRTDARFAKVGALAEKQKQKLIEDFAKIPTNAYEDLGKSVLDTRIEIDTARKNRQEALAQQLEKRLAKMVPEYSTAGGPMEAMAENLGRSRKQALESVDQFGDQGQIEKFNQEVKDFVKAIKPGADGPIETLTTSLTDLDKSAARLAEIAKDPRLGDNGLGAGLEAIKQKQNRLIADLEQGVLSPYEKFVQDSKKIAKGLEDAAKLSDPAQAKRLAEILKKQQEQQQNAFLDPVLTDFERFNSSWQNLQQELNTATAAGDQTGITRYSRELGKLFENAANTLPKIGDSFFADSAQIGSVESYRAEMRAQFGDASMSVQERMAAALERMELLDKQSLEKQEALRQAMANQRPMPGKLQIAPN